ncbi:hypothetical protein [Acinetobacter bereziniae]|uniref:hypothetical protein n=1 Tax=Acinetobacter bereziniae TaxID=106648 RepID=UPI0022571F98|nr:hypothetical protein [Acinetobacter bereziniae]
MFKNPKNVVIAYISVVCIYTLLFILQNKSNISLLDSSGLGDFLSGLFAPIAFLYLFLGFRQQEKALLKTQEDIAEQLNLQKMALELQIEERKQYEFELSPLISIKTRIIEKDLTSALYSLHKYIPIQSILQVTLKNLKKEAYNFNCDLVSPNQRNYINEQHFNSKEEKTFNIDLAQVLKQESTCKEVLKFQYSFTSLTGINYIHEFEIAIENDTNMNIMATYSEVGLPKKLSTYVKKAH